MENKSFYAPALRSTLEKIINDKDIIASQGFLTEMFNASTGISAILDENRQIVYTNSEFLDFLGLRNFKPVLGKRPGEVVSCINAKIGPSGCGTSGACKYCGAVNAILESQIENTKSVKETRITSEINGKTVSWDLKVASFPVNIDNHKFYVLTLQDISSEKKLKAMERIFFHDILNITGGLTGLLNILKLSDDPTETELLIDKSEEVSKTIHDEILAYRQIRAAENGDIILKLETINSHTLINDAIERIAFHEVGQNKKIIIEEGSAHKNIKTDKLLIQRVLINLLKNALEATKLHGTVRIKAVDKEGKILFKVKNSMVMPEEVKMQIFQRSFSTKDKNRGIGTYSIRLLTENYLNGKVSFISTEEEGTVFTVELPE